MKKLALIFVLLAGQSAAEDSIPTLVEQVANDRIALIEKTGQKCAAIGRHCRLAKLGLLQPARVRGAVGGGESGDQVTNLLRSRSIESTAA